MRKSLELVEEYTIIRSQDKSLVYDQFGYFDKETPLPIKRPPRTDNTPLVDVCKERARQLGNVNIAWSGGIDSTFVLAVFKSLNIDVTVVHFTDIDTDVNKNLLDYVKANFTVIEKTLSEWLARNEKVYTSAGADVLFNSEARPPRAELLIRYSNGNTEKVLKPIIEFNVTDNDLIAYGEYLGVDVVTNLDALRVLTLGCKFWHNAYNWGVPMDKLGRNQESFFDTERFMDIAFTQYFERQCLVNPPKTEEREFIKEIFGDDFGVVKN